MNARVAKSKSQERTSALLMKRNTTEIHTKCIIESLMNK
jgi:hypothetical protein